MARLRTAMDASFGDLNVSSPLCHDGWAKSVPGDHVPLDGYVGSKVLRPQQLSFLANGMAMPVAVLPSLSPTSPKDLGSFSLQSLLLSLASPNWWLTMSGQFRPRKLIANIKNDIFNAEEFDLSIVKDVAKHFINKSLYSFGLTSQFSFPSSTSMLFSVEGHGEKERLRRKVMVYHRLRDHDLSLEAAWPQLFVDHKGKYWEVPQSISVDLSSLVSDSGLRYRMGLHKNGGDPQAINTTDGNPPLSLLPGLCAKAAVSYEKIKEFWREEAEKRFYYPDEGPYDVHLNEPHAAISGIIGGNFASWILDGTKFSGIDSREDLEVSKRSRRSRLNVDLFGSVCYSFQRGKFTEFFGDLTRVDARLDVSSASALTKKIASCFKRSAANDSEQSSASPRLNLIFQQQIAGPLVFRADSRISLGSLSMEDFICSLSYSLRSLNSGKVVAWYSPKRKEGMVELRLYEF